MQTVSVLMKPASGMCNMKCSYCFYCDEAEKREQSSYGMMTEETLKNVIRKTLPYADELATYAYQGGEPTLRGIDFFRKAVELQKKYNAKNVDIDNVIQTNGYGIDEEWCRFLSENRFLVGISVDGTKELHDTFRRDSRGGPTFDRVIKTTEMFDRFGVEYNILTVVTADAAKSIEDIYREYRSRGWRFQQYIPCLDPIGVPHGQDEHALSPEIYGKFLVTLFRLWKKDLDKGRQPFIRQFENYIDILVGYQPEACDQRGTCGLQYVVEADGGVYPCDFYVLDGYRLGSFNENRLPEIDERREETGFIQRSRKLEESCLSCPYHFICRGGCQRNRDLTQAGEYRNYFCEGFKMFFDECLEDLKDIASNI